MTYGFLVFYKFKQLNEEEEKKARNFWKEFRNNLPGNIKLVGEYKHAWGTQWNGYLVLEAETMNDFIKFWPIFRDKTRWYVQATETIISTKTE